MPHDLYIPARNYVKWARGHEMACNMHGVLGKPDLKLQSTCNQTSTPQPMLASPGLNADMAGAAPSLANYPYDSSLHHTIVVRTWTCPDLDPHPGPEVPEVQEIGVETKPAPLLTWACVSYSKSC